MCPEAENLRRRLVASACSTAIYGAAFLVQRGFAQTTAPFLVQLPTLSPCQRYRRRIGWRPSRFTSSGRERFARCCGVTVPIRNRQVSGSSPLVGSIYSHFFSPVTFVSPVTQLLHAPLKRPVTFDIEAIRDPQTWLWKSQLSNATVRTTKSTG